MMKVYWIIGMVIIVTFGSEHVGPVSPPHAPLHSITAPMTGSNDPPVSDIQWPV